MDRKDFYFGQKVTEAELDAAFADVESALQQFIAGFSYVGIAVGAEITEHAPQNFTVDANGPAIIYNQVQERIGWSPTQNVNLSLDELGSATAVVGAANSKYLTIFAEFKRAESDARIDGFGKTLFHVLDESFQINVAQGAEAVSPIRPALRPEQILLADVLITFGQTVIVNGDVDSTRTEVIYQLAGVPNSINERGLQDALQEMLDIVNGFNVATIAAPTITDAPFSLGVGSIATQFAELLALINDEAALRRHPSAFEAGSLPVNFETTDAGLALWGTTKIPGDEPGFPETKYKLLWKAPVGPTGSHFIRCYAGGHRSDDVAPFNGMQIAFTLNAVWVAGGAEFWGPDDVTETAMLIGMTVLNPDPGGTAFSVLSRRDTSTIWADSDWDIADLANGQLNGSLFISGDYLYQGGSRTRVSRLNLMDGVSHINNPEGTPQWVFGLSGAATWRTSNGFGQVAASTSNLHVIFPINLPTDAVLKKVDIIYERGKAAGTGVDLKVFYASGATFGASPVIDPAYQLLDEVLNHKESNANDLSTINLTMTKVLAAASQTHIRIQCKDVDGTSSDFIHGIQLTWEEKGVRN